MFSRVFQLVFASKRMMKSLVIVHEPAIITLNWGCSIDVNNQDVDKNDGNDNVNNGE